jgi:hypothetical protein
MKTLRVKNSDNKRDPAVRPYLVLIAGVVIAASAAAATAQTAIVTGTQQPAEARTRQRRSTTEEPRDEGEAAAIVERPATTHKERRVFVRSTSLLVRAAVVEDKLLKQPEFHQLGFVLTRDEAEADFILELRHDLFTKYVFSVVETRDWLVVASGKLSSVGGTVGGKVARRFVKEMSQPTGP